MKKNVAIILALTVCCVLLAACGGAPAAQQPTAAPASQPTAVPAADAPAETAAPQAAEETPAEGAPLPDGVYRATFDTDSSMFHINEAHDGKGVLTVEDGRMTIHITLASKKITLLFAGLAADAKKDGAAVIEPTTDTVTYKDGDTSTAFGFDLPVPWLDEEFDCAILGSKGNWYDHKVIVSDPVPME